MKKILLNPLFYYSFGFFVAVGLLSINISGLYSSLDFSLFIFIFFTSWIALFFVYITSSFVSKKIDFSFKNIHETNKKNSILIFFILLTLFLVDCLSVMTIPLLEVILGRSYRYSQFGVPVWHAFTITYSSIICFSYFLKYKKTAKAHHLIVFLFALFISLLMVNRAVFIYNIIGIIALYIAFKGDFKVIKKVVIFVIFVVCLFSLLGNLRTISDTKDNASVNNRFSLKEVARIESEWVPEILVWPYMYLVSPYGNLQEDFNRSKYTNYNADRISPVITHSILPDFISKRIADEYEKSKYSNYLVEDTFNVSTAYAGMVKIYGIYGMIIFFIYYLLFILFFIFLSPSRYFVIIMAGLCSTSFLLIFTNGLYNLTQFSFPFLVIFLSKIRFGKYYFI